MPTVKLVPFQKFWSFKMILSSVCPKLRSESFLKTLNMSQSQLSFKRWCSTDCGNDFVSIVLLCFQFYLLRYRLFGWQFPIHFWFEMEDLRKSPFRPKKPFDQLPLTRKLTLFLFRKFRFYDWAPGDTSPYQSHYSPQGGQFRFQLVFILGISGKYIHWLFQEDVLTFLVFLL